MRSQFFLARVVADSIWSDKTLMLEISDAIWSAESSRVPFPTKTFDENHSQPYTSSGLSNGYMDYFVSGGCYSYIGRVGAKNPISIGRGCEHHGIIQHETMHALGFHHEQVNDSVSHENRIKVGRYRQPNIAKFDNITIFYYRYQKSKIVCFHFWNCLSREILSLIIKVLWTCDVCSQMRVSDIIGFDFSPKYTTEVKFVTQILWRVIVWHFCEKNFQL